MATPNIFTYATSELSQDAFILWLLDWANPKNANIDKSLCETAQAFARLLLDKTYLEISSVVCKKQEHHIDVFAVINEQYALIIEDKTNTSEHGNQIKRYSEWVKKESKYANLELHCVYYKTGNESKHKLNSLKSKYAEDLHDEAFFRIITKEEVLDILQQSKSKNAILLDYINRIKYIQRITTAYGTIPYKDWKWETWQGFYIKLEDLLKDGDWGYVANPSGGFLGYWWHWCPMKTDLTIELYLQFEQDKLCIKAYSKAETRPQFVWTDQIVKLSKAEDLHVEFPNRRKIGKTMTLAVIKLEYLFDVPLNFDMTIEKLNKLKDFVTKVSQQIE